MVNTTINISEYQQVDFKVPYRLKFKLHLLVQKYHHLCKIVHPGHVTGAIRDLTAGLLLPNV